MLSRVRVSNAAPMSRLTPISFAEPRLEHRDKDFEDKEFQMDEDHPNLGLTKQSITEKDLNIDWTDEEEHESIKGVDDSKVRPRSDNKGVGHMFETLSEMSQWDA